MATNLEQEKTKQEILAAIDYADTYTDLANNEYLGGHVHDTNQAIALSMLAIVHYLKAIAVFARKDIEAE